jgi:hypothetical protein
MACGTSFLEFLPRQARHLAEKLGAMKPAKAAEIVDNGIGEMLSYYHLPSKHWRCLHQQPTGTADA